MRIMHCLPFGFDSEKVQGEVKKESGRMRSEVCEGNWWDLTVNPFFVGGHVGSGGWWGRAFLVLTSSYLKVSQRLSSQFLNTGRTSIILSLCEMRVGPASRRANWE